MAKIVAFAGSSAPTGWYACEGQSLLRADEPELFADIGTTYGAVDGTHFSLPDLRDRFALGKAASGTGSVLGQAGGALGHQHALSHAHAVTQPGDHAAHSVTQPSAHSSLTHSGFGADDHPAVSHSGMSVANHTVTQSSGHGKHNSAGSHDHDSHVAQQVLFASFPSAIITSPTTHQSDGSHDHDSHSAHTESVSAHSISDQGDDHGIQTHSVTQPSSHSLSAHAFTVSAHSAHTGAAAASASVTSGAADPPFLALIFIIAPDLTAIPAGAVVEHGSNTIPDDHLLCDGSAVSRTTYAALFAVTDEDFGPGDGSTTFNLPDLRGRHVIGTGSTSFATSGGAANHIHAGASHGHTVTQPASHSTHTVTQPAHAALSHSGAALGSHSMSHSGFSVSGHTVTQSSGHGTHSSDGSHSHNSHTTGTADDGSTQVLKGPITHSPGGSHSHNSHSAHSGASLNGHAETQANTHTPSHSVTQPNDHGSLAHAGAALDAHSAHSGAALNSSTSAATDSGEAPYLALRYIIRTTLGGQPIGALYRIGQATAPSGTLLAQGQLVSRSTYADLFAEIGESYGAGDGSTTFAVPDLRGRIPRGANGDLAASGGALDHSHAVSATHTHTAIQPATHSAHSPTEPDGHGSLSHSGASASSHSLSHSGADINNHSATQADSHSAHTSAGGHTHDSHTKVGTTTTGGGGVTARSTPTTHASDGSHTHSGAHSHSGFGVNGHSVGQANSHSLSHSVGQPNAHSVSAHSGFAVDAHGAHSGFGVAAAGTGTTDAANPPYLVVNYVIQVGVDVFSLARTATFAIGTPQFHVTAYEVALNEVPLTPPSSPIVYILDPPS